MAYSTCPLVSTGELWTAANQNNFLRDNWLASWVGTTAGDMDYYTAATTKSRLPIGTAYQNLRVNAGATAPEWGSGGMTLIEEKLLGAPAASFDFTTIPATYRHLFILYDGRSDKAAYTKDSVRLRLNNDSGNNYDFKPISTSGVTVVTAVTFAESYINAGIIPAALATANVSSSGKIFFPNYRLTTFQKTSIIEGDGKSAEAGNDGIELRIVAAYWRNTAAVNQITLYPGAGNWETGSVASLYGMM